MYNSYMDSVRLAIEHGAPDIFLTFTCNPRWPEIVRWLAKRGFKPDEYMHAPDIVVRVFLARVDKFISDLIHSVLGRVKAYVGVFKFEFTTTMMPHFHLALILHPLDKPKDSAYDVDATVSGEIADREAESELHDLVMSLMLHNPCDGSVPGYDNPYCRPNGQPCKHGFPKAFSDSTTVLNRNIKLRRRKSVKYWHRRCRCFVDNRWVIEYNGKLLMANRNHLNVRLSSGNMFFKYIFNYMQKEGKGKHIQGSMRKF